MQKICLLLISSMLFARAVCADPALLARSDVQSYINEQVASGRFSRSELESLFNNVEIKPRIIEIMDSPSTAQPWYKFRPNHVSESLVSGGVNFWRANRVALNRAEKIYGVPASIIVAIIGVETRYGRNAGNIRVADALVTLGFDYPRRAEFFRSELSELLLLAKEEHRDPLEFNGSYAGAMGMPQFMPSSFRKWAIDFDGDGQRNIWNDNSDAIGSVANYFQQHGWLRDGQIIVPAQVNQSPQIDSLLADKFNLHYNVGELKQIGVIPKGRISDSAKAVLFSLEIAPNANKYWLGLNNFYVITRYNKSAMYAKAVQELSEEIRRRYS